MEVKDYLIVYGHNTVRGGSCYKESIINCNDLVKFSEIIKTIINTKTIIKAIHFKNLTILSLFLKYYSTY